MKEVTIENNGRVRVRTLNTEPSRTQEQFAEECDVNHIISRYKKTGEITHRARKAGVYADISEISDYHTMVNRVADAQKAFYTLSAEVRRRFNDDPGALIEFLQDSNNREEAIKLGLIDRPDLGTQLNDDLNNDKTVPKTGKTKQKPSAPEQSSTPPKEE